MKRLLLLIPLIFLYSGGYVGGKTENLASYIRECDWGKAYSSYILTNKKNIPKNLKLYVEMRFFEDMDNLDSALVFANKLAESPSDTIFHDIVRIYGKTHNDSLILCDARVRNDSLTELFYFIQHNEMDSILRYINILPDTSFYRIYKLILLGKHDKNFTEKMKKTDYETRAYIYERLYLYDRAIQIRKKLRNFRGIKNIYSLARDYYLSGDKEAAYYYFKIIVNNFPNSEYALRSLRYLRRNGKIHGKLRYTASRIYTYFGIYRRALAVIAPLSRYSRRNKELRAVCYYHLKRYRRTIGLFRRERKNYNSEASFYIGLSYYRMRKYAEAQRYLKYYIKYCHNIGLHTGEAYYRMGQIDKKNALSNYTMTLKYNIPAYFKERALFAIYESGDTSLYHDIISRFILNTDELTPKMAYVLMKMSAVLNNRGLSVYYAEYLKNRYPVNYYTVKNGSNNFNNMQPIKNYRILKPVEAAIKSGYTEIAKKMIEESRIGRYYLPLAECAFRSGDYPLSINFARRYLNYCVKTGNSINDSLYYFLFPRGYATIVREASTEYNVDKYLIYAIIREESWFQRRALSRMGAIGVMQILPSTFRHLKKYQRNRYFDPTYNIHTGTLYLSQLDKSYNGNMLQVIAHYNGGNFPAMGGNNPDFIEHIPYVETEKYVKHVMRSYEIYKSLYNNI